MDFSMVFSDWNELNLDSKLLENIVEHSKYVRPRQIQSRAIPYILEGKQNKIRTLILHAICQFRI